LDFAKDQTPLKKSKIWSWVEKHFGIFPQQKDDFLEEVYFTYQANKLDYQFVDHFRRTLIHYDHELRQEIELLIDSFMYRPRKSFKSGDSTQIN
jgi:hypothetical protein